ncbi:hypothetical protein NORO109296_21105 [Nocardiopsis rhodophaea]
MAWNVDIDARASSTVVFMTSINPSAEVKASIMGPEGLPARIAELELGGKTEQELRDHPEERGEILLDAAAVLRGDGELTRALGVYQYLIEEAVDREDAQYATVGKIDVLLERGDGTAADAELRELWSRGPMEGPAVLLGELLEGNGRMEDALSWFDFACRGHLNSSVEQLEDVDLAYVPELVGRARVRGALGYASDEFDLLVCTHREKWLGG